MTDAESEIYSLMQSTQRRYFPELDDLVFLIEKRPGINGVAMRVEFDSPARVSFYYDDDRVLSYKYRMGLVPVIGHELAHLISPVDPEEVMRKRLPASMMQLWEALREEGLAVCSMDSRVAEGGGK